MTDHIVIGEGLGLALTNGGLLTFASQIQRAYPKLNLITFGSSVDDIIDDLTSLPDTDRIIIGGYSRGANLAPGIAKAIKRPVEYLFQFQPSYWYGYRTEPVPANVRRAFCVYNPYFFETFGLGFLRSYKAEDNTATVMEVVMAQDSHGGVQYNPAYRTKVLAAIGDALKPKGVS